MDHCPEEINGHWSNHQDWLSDPACKLGFSIFETMRSIDQRIIWMDDHMRRLIQSAALLGIPLPSRRVLESAIFKILNEADSTHLGLRLTVSQSGLWGIRTWAFDESRIGRSISLARFIDPPHPYVPRAAKHSNRLLWVQAAKNLEVDEVLLCDASNSGLETNNSNIYMLWENRVYTPPADGTILAGITRLHLKKVVTELGLHWIEQRLSRSLCDEGRMNGAMFYVSSTLKEIAPVSVLDGIPCEVESDLFSLIKEKYKYALIV